MLYLKPIKKPKLRSRAWYRLNAELQDAELMASTRKRRKRRNVVRSLVSAMAGEKLPGSENSRVMPDRRKSHEAA